MENGHNADFGCILGLFSTRVSLWRTRSSTKKRACSLWKRRTARHLCRFFTRCDLAAEIIHISPTACPVRFPKKGREKGKKFPLPVKEKGTFHSYSQPLRILLRFMISISFISFIARRAQGHLLKTKRSKFHEDQF